MTAILLSVLAAAGFVAASLLGLLGGKLGAGSRSYPAAVAAGILLALAFADLFPEGLELAGDAAILGFVGGFSGLFLIEAFTRAHTHHTPAEHIGKHALGPFALGLAIHNLADGFVLGVGARAAEVTSGLIGLGILIHQLPVGVSLAAVFAAAGAARGRVVRTTLLLGLAIPLAAALTLILPVPGDTALGFLTGIAGGVLAYVGTALLLPEAQTEHPSRGVGIVLVATLVGTTLLLMTVLQG